MAEFDRPPYSIDDSLIGEPLVRSDGRVVMLHEDGNVIDVHVGSGYAALYSTAELVRLGDGSREAGILRVAQACVYGEINRECRPLHEEAYSRLDY